MPSIKEQTAETVSRLSADYAVKYGGIVVVAILKLFEYKAFRSNSMLGVYARMVKAWEAGRNAPDNSENPFDADQYTQRAEFYAWKRGVESKPYDAKNQYVLGRDKSIDARERLVNGKDQKGMPFAELYVRLDHAGNGIGPDDDTPDPWLANDKPVEPVAVSQEQDSEGDALPF